MTLFGNEVSAYVISLVHIKSTRLGSALNPIRILSVNKEEKHRIHREDVCVKMEAEMAVMWPQAKDCCKPAEARKGKEGFFLRAFRGSMALPTL